MTALLSIAACSLAAEEEPPGKGRWVARSQNQKVSHGQLIADKRPVSKVALGA